MFRAILKINDIPYDLSTTTNEKVDKKTESVKKSGHSPALLYTFLKYCLSIRHLWFLSFFIEGLQISLYTWFQVRNVIFYYMNILPDISVYPLLPEEYAPNALCP